MHRLCFAGAKLLPCRTRTWHNDGHPAPADPQLRVHSAVSLTQKASACWKSPPRRPVIARNSAATTQNRLPICLSPCPAGPCGGLGIALDPIRAGARRRPPRAANCTLGSGSPTDTMYDHEDHSSTRPDDHGRCGSCVAGSSLPASGWGTSGDRAVHQPRGRRRHQRCGLGPVTAGSPGRSRPARKKTASGLLACGALQRIRSQPLRIARVTAATHPLMDLAARSKLSATWYRSYWFCDPAPPLALASALRFSQSGAR